MNEKITDDIALEVYQIMQNKIPTIKLEDVKNSLQETYQHMHMKPNQWKKENLERFKQQVIESMILWSKNKK